jgi:hypothetical protein
MKVFNLIAGANFIIIFCTKYNSENIYFFLAIWTSCQNSSSGKKRSSNGYRKLPPRKIVQLAAETAETVTRIALSLLLLYSIYIYGSSIG